MLLDASKEELQSAANRTPSSETGDMYKNLDASIAVFRQNLPPDMTPEEVEAEVAKYKDEILKDVAKDAQAVTDKTSSPLKEGGLAALDLAAKTLDAGRASVAPALQKIALGLPYEHGRSWKDALEKVGMKNTALSEIVPGAFDTVGDVWYKPNVGGWADLTGSGTLGFAADIASDPLTYVGAAPVRKLLGGGLSAIKNLVRGASTAEKAAIASKAAKPAENVITKVLNDLEKAPVAKSSLGKVADKITSGVDTILNPMSKATEKVGEKVYEAPFKNMGLDLMSAKKGKEAISKTLSDLEFKGGAQALEDLVHRVSTISNRTAKTTLAKTVGTDAAIDVRKVLQPTIAKLEKLMGHQGTASEAQKALNYLLPETTAYFGKVDLQLANDIKNKTLGKIAYPASKADPARVIADHDVQKVLRRGYANLQRKIESETSRVLGPEGGRALRQSNAMTGKMLAVREGVRNAAAKGALSTPSTSEAMQVLAGLGIGTMGGSTASHVAGGLIAAPTIVKRLLGASKTMAGATYGGKGLQWIGKNVVPAADIAARRELLDWADKYVNDQYKEIDNGQK